MTTNKDPFDEIIYGLLHLSSEYRQLKRSLWLARAMRAKTEYERYANICGMKHHATLKWKNAESKCRAKADEYK